MDLGPYGPKLAAFLFASTPGYEPRVIVSARKLLLGEEELDELILPPFRNKAWGRRGWVFEVGNLRWIVHLDQRYRNRIPAEIYCNGRDPVTILDLGERQLADWPGLASLAAQVHRSGTGGDASRETPG